MIELINKILSKFKYTGTLTSADLNNLNAEFNKILSTNNFIAWIIYIKNNKLNFERIHNNFEENNIFEFKDNKLIINLLSQTLELTSEEFQNLYIIPLETPLPIPQIKPSQNQDLFDDYTNRDYFAAYKSILNLISLVSPDLINLITERNSPDYLFLDAMAYLYDRLQFYIDFATNLRDPEKATGEYLDLILRFYGFDSIPYPLPSTLPIPIIMNNNLFPYIILYFLKDAGYNLLINPELRLKVSNIELSAIIETNLFKNKIKTTKKEAYLFLSKLIFENVKERLIYPKKSVYSFLNYKYLTLNSTTFTLNFSISRNFKIFQRYVDPTTISLKLKNNDGEIYPILNLLDYNKILLRAEQIRKEIENSNLPKTFKFIPVYIKTNRYGEIELIFFNSPLSDLTKYDELEFELTYYTHNGADSNDAEYSEKEEIFYITKNNIINNDVSCTIEFIYENTLYQANLKDIINQADILYEKYNKKNPPIPNFNKLPSNLFAIIYYNITTNNIDTIRSDLFQNQFDCYLDEIENKSTGGTYPLTDDELRSIIKVPLQKQYWTISPIQYYKRAITEEDYEIILNSNPIVPIIGTKIYYRKVEISDILDKFIAIPYKNLISIPILPFYIDIYLLQKYIKQYEISHQSQKELFNLIDVKYLSSSNISQLLKYLDNFRLPTHYIRIYNPKITRYYLQGTIYTNNIFETKKKLMIAQNLINLNQTVGKGLNADNIFSIFTKLITDAIFDIEFSTKSAAENEYIYLDLTKIAVKSFIDYKEKFKHRKIISPPSEKEE